MRRQSVHVLQDHACNGAADTAAMLSVTCLLVGIAIVQQVDAVRQLTGESCWLQAIVLLHGHPDISAMYVHGAGCNQPATMSPPRPPCRTHRSLQVCHALLLLYFHRIMPPCFFGTQSR